MIKEIMPDGRTVVDENGDVLPRHDFSRDEYPEPPEEMLRMKSIVRAIDTYEESQRMRLLATRGSRDKNVQKAGGVNACKKRGIELSLEARALYIHTQGVDVITSPDLNDPKYDEKIDEFTKGTALWMTFREDILKHEDVRFAKRHELGEKIEQYEKLFY